MAEHTVLLVDADHALAEQVAAALAPYGCRATILGDATSVLSHPLVPALIVLCIDPKKVGWSIVNSVRKHPLLRGVPLIVTSAEATDADFDSHKKLKWRADEYMRKPLDLERIVGGTTISSPSLSAPLAMPAIPARPMASSSCCTARLSINIESICST